MRHMGFLLLTAALLVALSPGRTQAAAGTTGKVTGRITEAASGEGLPGVNVTIEGTNRGATTDVEGAYIILAVEPGTYTVKASMIGYTAERKSGVRVIADYTSTVDFALKEAALEMAEVVVVAERPPVEPDKTTSKHVVSAADVEAVPMVRSAAALIALQPGVALDGQDRIRGSEVGNVGEAVGYYVDGIRVTRGRFDNVNTSAIEEVDVLTGGMNAEFGNALAGVVTLVTREGARQAGGKVEYVVAPPAKRHWGENIYDNPYHEDKMKWDDPAWVNETYRDNGHPGPDGVLNTADDDDRIHVRSGYSDHTGHRVEGSLSGPVGGSASFFLSTVYNRGVSRLPSASPTSPFNTRNVGNVTFRPSSSLKVKVGGLLERTESFYVRDANWEGALKGMTTGATGRNVFLPEDWAASGKQKTTGNLIYLTLTQTLGPKTYYEARVYSTLARQEPLDVPEATEPVKTDKAGWFYLPRKIRASRDYSDRISGAKLDYASQVTKSHLAQTGVEYRRHNYWETNIWYGSAPNFRVMNFVGKDYDPGKGVEPWDVAVYVQDKLEYAGLVVNAGLRWDYFNYGRPWRQAPGIEISEMFTKFTYRKYELPFLEKGNPTFTSLSPRVGISHPINDRLAAHYFIGKFHTNPPLDDLFRMAYASQVPDRDVNGNGKIDETEMWNSMDALNSFAMGGDWHATEGVKPQASTSVEMGVDWNFVTDYTSSVTAHYRLDEGLYGDNSIIYWNSPKLNTSQIGVLRNAYWTSSRGVELSLRKSFSHNFSFRLAYDLSWQHGIGYGGSSPHYGNFEGNWYIYPDSNYVASDRYWYKWAAQPDGSEVPVPLTDAEKKSLGAAANAIVKSWVDRAGTPAATGRYSQPFKINEAGLWVTASNYGALPAPRNFGRRNQMSLQLLYSTPSEYGPRVGSFHPLASLRISSVHRLYSGNPFQYTPPTGPSEWRNESPSMRTDVHLRKDFAKLGALQPSLFMEVTNLFNEKSTEAQGFGFIQYGLNEPAPDDPDFQSYGDTSAWNRYVWDPRLVQLGLTLTF